MDHRLRPSIQVSPPDRRPPNSMDASSFSQDTTPFVSYLVEALSLTPTDVVVEPPVPECFLCDVALHSYQPWYSRRIYVPAALQPGLEC